MTWERIYALHRVNPGSAYENPVELVDVFAHYSDLLDYAWGDLAIAFDQELGISDTDSDGIYYFVEKCKADIKGEVP